MTHHLTLELADDVYQRLVRAAQQAGQSVEEWAAVQLRSCAVSSVRQTDDLTRLLAHAGAVDLGRPTNADNEGIDADLAREYGSAHEGRP